MVVGCIECLKRLLHLFDISVLDRPNPVTIVNCKKNNDNNNNERLKNYLLNIYFTVLS